MLFRSEIHLSRHKFYLILFGGEDLGAIVEKIKKVGWQVSNSGDDLLRVTEPNQVLEVSKSYPNWQDFVNLANIEGILTIELIPVYELSIK